MSAGFLIFLVVALVIAVLITVDVLKTPDEIPQEQADWHPFESDRSLAGAPRDAGIRTFAPERTEGAAAAAAAAQDPGGRRRAGTSAAPRRAAGRGIKNWPVGLRLFLLAIIPAVAAAVVAVCVIRMTEVLRGTAINSQVSSVRDGAIVSALVDGVVLFVVVVIALTLGAVLARSVLRPLRRLRARAVEVADVQLPDMVRLISESDGEGVPHDVQPVDVNSVDEIGDVAHAFDQVHREVLRLATNEATIRGKINTIFINLSRRSQTLVERQIRLIDELEPGEQQPDRRANLFKLDRLVTRQRRYSQNLLVLAGQEVSGHSGQPMALVQVIRIAVSEIEEPERVSLNVDPAIAVAPPAVNDVVHLLAELVENATSLSSADTPVLISGHRLVSGGVLIDITDRGFGMSVEEMAHANWRLDNPPVADITVFKSMGLLVVGRLAARHGIRIRLRPAESGGLTALVWLPNAVTLQQEMPAAPGRAGFGGGQPRPQVRPDVPEATLTGRFRHADPERATAE